MTFDPEGVIPISFGGTGASSVEAARDSLHLSAIQDSTVGTESYPGFLSPCVFNKNLRKVTGLQLAGFMVMRQVPIPQRVGHTAMPKNRLSTASATCSSAEGEGTTASGNRQPCRRDAEPKPQDSLLMQKDTIRLPHPATHMQKDTAHWRGVLQLTQKVICLMPWGFIPTQKDAKLKPEAPRPHAEGQDALASGDVAHAEGFQTIADGYASHAGGYASVAAGLYSRAIGRNTTATATAAFATGNGVVADQENGTAIGQYNVLSNLWFSFFPSVTEHLIRSVPTLSKFTLRVMPSYTGTPL